MLLTETNLQVLSFVYVYTSQGAEPKIIETYSKLTMRDAMEVMRRNPSTIGQMTGTESMSALFRNYTNNYIGGRWAPPTIYTTW